MKTEQGAQQAVDQPLVIEQLDLLFTRTTTVCEQQSIEELREQMKSGEMRDIILAGMLANLEGIEGVHWLRFLLKEYASTLSVE